MQGFTHLGAQMFLGGTFFSTPLYVGLLQALPTSSDGSGYVEACARQMLPGWEDAAFPSAAAKANAQDLVFGPLGAPGGGVAAVGWALFDAQEGGDLLCCGPFGPPGWAAEGDMVTIQQGQLLFSISEMM